MKVTSGISAGNRANLAQPIGIKNHVNTETEYLLLTYAFGVLKVVRAQLMNDELSEKSKAAILRIGAKQKDIIRNERIMSDGRMHNSLLFSIINSGWPQVRRCCNTRLKLDRRPFKRFS